MTKNNERIKSVKCEASVHAWVAMWDSGGSKTSKTENGKGGFEYDFRGKD